MTKKFYKQSFYINDLKYPETTLFFERNKIIYFRNVLLKPFDLDYRIKEMEKFISEIFKPFYKGKKLKIASLESFKPEHYLQLNFVFNLEEKSLSNLKKFDEELSDYLYKSQFVSEFAKALFAKNKRKRIEWFERVLSIYSIK